MLFKFLFSTVGLREVLALYVREISVSLANDSHKCFVHVVHVAHASIPNLDESGTQAAAFFKVTSPYTVPRGFHRN